MKFQEYELDLKGEIAIVSPASKRVHFTVTPIGGKAELEKWKVERKKLEAVYEAKMIECRKVVATNSALIVAGYKAPPERTKLEMAETAYIDSRARKGKYWVDPMAGAWANTDGTYSFDNEEMKQSAFKRFLTKFKDFVAKSLSTGD